ncbi:B12-binding domain-containing radical SAM protein [Bdellovibrio sp. GT3]|uniref:B12-binding domain-containing radical SAM protein n=1 Tax=Bdellovibrio sp. GT3 TaxID=3136282 RepID=UPI0030F1B4FB
MDILFLNPPISEHVYQNLSGGVATLELPVWMGMLTASMKSMGHSADQIDCAAEALQTSQTYDRITQLNPKLVCIVVYGQHPSASTQAMFGASYLCTELKKLNPQLKVIMLGGHISALPLRTMQDEVCDFVCEGEGPRTLDALLQTDLETISYLRKVPGLWFRDDGRIEHNPTAPLIEQKLLGSVFPEVDLQSLPMGNYKAPNWHCFDHIDQRQPYATVYTSLGCPFKCSFCCISAPFGKQGTFRYWDPEFIIKQFDVYASLGVKNIKIADEMFVLKEEHFLRIAELLIERKYNFNIWVFGRIDTIKPHHVDKLKAAGINWIVLGIEAFDQKVRTGVNKGRYTEEDIFEKTKMLKDGGIHVHGNFVFGLPDDTLETMQRSLDLAVELNLETANFYSAMAYPGSELYREAVRNNTELPETWLGYSQHSYDCKPLPTKYISSSEVLTFRDQAWSIYHNSPSYLNLIKTKFGQKTYDYIVNLKKINLSRKYSVDKVLAKASYE